MPFVAARNPIDVTGQFLNDPSLLDQAIELATTNGDYRSVVNFQGLTGCKAANSEMPFAVSGFCTPAYTRDLETIEIPVYEEKTHATHASAGIAGFARSFRERPPRPDNPTPAEPLNEFEPFGVVAASGVPLVPAHDTKFPREAAEAAADLGFPVVLKAQPAHFVQNCTSFPTLSTTGTSEPVHP